MRGIHLPTFVSAVNIDMALRSGESTSAFSVQCINCGAMGTWDDWVGRYEGARLCPSCGQYTGMEIKGDDK